MASSVSSLIEDSDLTVALDHSAAATFAVAGVLAARQKRMKVPGLSWLLLPLVSAGWQAETLPGSVPGSPAPSTIRPHFLSSGRGDCPHLHETEAIT